MTPYPIRRFARFATTAFLAFPVGSSFVLAATYYVATNGNDTNPGTLSSPWKSLSKAGATAGPGDTVLIRGGNYPVTTTQYLAKSGTPTAWITFKNYQNEEPIFTGTNLNTAVDDAVIMVREQSYILIDGLNINESRGQGFSVFKGNFVTIQNCTTYLTWMSGIGIWGDLATTTPSRNIKVLNNKVEKANSYDAPGADQTRPQAPHEAISFGRVEDFEIAYNEVWGGDKEGIDAKGPCKRGKIHSNVVHDQSATAIYVDGWSAAAEDIEVYNNIVRDTKTGIAVAAEGGTPLSNVRIHNNQLIRIQRVALGIGGYGSIEQNKPEGAKSNIHFVNNTIHGADHAFNTTSTKATNITVRNNIFSGIRFKELILGADVNLTAQNIQIDYNLPKTTDPKFVDAAADNLRLLAGSPAINNGHPGSQYNDADGSRNDQGAFAYTGGGGTSPNTAPAFTDQPDSVTKAAGTSHTFSVVVSGKPAPTLQWRKNGVNIAGATSPSYTLSNIQSSAAGTYTVVATNSVSSATSANAVLTVTTGGGNPGGGSVVTLDSSDPAKFSTNTGWWSLDLAGAQGGSTYTSTNNAANLATYTPGLSGTYKLEVFVPAWTRLSTGVPYTVKHASGSTPITLNQAAAAGTWVRLGSADFTLDAASTITVSGAVTQVAGQTEKRALADALRFTPATPPPPPSSGLKFEVETLAHTQSDTLTTYNEAAASGGSYDHLAANAVGDYVQYTANVPTAGTYTIKVAFKGAANRGRAQLKIDGTNQGAPFDQRPPGYQSVTLGTKTLSAGNHTFRFQVSGTSGTGYSLSVDALTLE